VELYRQERFSRRREISTLADVARHGLRTTPPYPWLPRGVGSLRCDRQGGGLSTRLSPPRVRVVRRFGEFFRPSREAPRIMTAQDIQPIDFVLPFAYGACVCGHPASRYLAMERMTWGVCDECMCGRTAGNRPLWRL